MNFFLRICILFTTVFAVPSELMCHSYTIPDDDCPHGLEVSKTLVDCYRINGALCPARGAPGTCGKCYSVQLEGYDTVAYVAVTSDINASEDELHIPYGVMFKLFSDPVNVQDCRDFDVWEGIINEFDCQADDDGSTDVSVFLGAAILLL